MFRYKARLFRIFGITLSADWTWLLLVFLVTWSLATGVLPQALPDETTGTYWGMGLLGALGIFISIAVHEFCHALVGRHYSLPMNEITLFLFGGVAHMEDEPPSPKAEFLMALVGPLASLIMAGLFGLALAIGQTYGVSDLWLLVLAYLSGINLIIAIFNLIPAYPLDGGRILRSILWAFKQDLMSSTQISARIGQGFGYALVLFGVFQMFSGYWFNGIWMLFLGLLLAQVAKASVWQLELKMTFEDKTVSSFLNPHPITVRPHESLAQFMDQHLHQDPQLIYPVVEERRLIGCIDIRKTKQISKEQWDTTQIVDAMEDCPQKLLTSPETKLMDALKQLSQPGASELIVVNSSNELIGTLSLQSLVKYLELQGSRVPFRQTQQPSPSSS